MVQKSLMSSYANFPAASAAIPSVLPHLLEKFGGATLVCFSVACSILGIAEQTGRNLHARHKFPVPTVRVGGARRVPLSALAAFVDAAARGARVDFEAELATTPAPVVAQIKKTIGPRGGTREERAEANAMGIKVSELRRNKVVASSEEMGRG